MNKATDRPCSEERGKHQVTLAAHGKCDMEMRTGNQEEDVRPMLPTSLERFIVHRRIDSFHKLWFLLFLHQRSNENRVNREYLRQVTFADDPTLDEVIDELQNAGLLKTRGESLSIVDDQEVRSDLDRMASVFEDPWGRQELLRRLYRHAGVAFLAVFVK